MDISKRIREYEESRNSDRCIGLDHNGNCGMLTEIKCAGYKVCHFYKTQSQQEASIAYCKQRCRELGYTYGASQGGRI